MIITEFYLTRSDGVCLYKTYDGVEQPDGTYTPSGLKIKKIGTDEVYSFAIDIEDSGFSYETTDIQIINDEDFSDINDTEETE